MHFAAECLSEDQSRVGSSTLLCSRSIALIGILQLYVPNPSQSDTIEHLLFQVSIATRPSLILADVIVIFATWLKVYSRVRILPLYSGATTSAVMLTDGKLPVGLIAVMWPVYSRLLS